MLARPVYGRAALLLGQVAKAVDSHELENIGYSEEVFYLLPLLGELHRRGDELDAHTEYGRGEPDVLHGRAHPEDRVEARELSGPVLGLVEEDCQKQRRSGDKLAVVLGEDFGDAEAIHNALAGVREDLTPKRFQGSGQLVDVDAVPALLHLLFRESEVRPVALPEGSLLHKSVHRLAAYAGDLLYDPPVVYEDEAPGLAVEM